MQVAIDREDCRRDAAAPDPEIEPVRGSREEPVCLLPRRMCTAIPYLRAQVLYIFLDFHVV